MKTLYSFVSVVIPVFNDNAHLKLCLEALSQQTYPQDAYEIIVIDNNSQEDVSYITAQLEGVRLDCELRPGSYVARNRGIEIAQGEIIAFTDADCIPAPNWLKSGVEVLKSAPNIGLVAGRVDLFVKDPGCPNCFELYEKVALDFPQDQFLANDHFGVTANLFTFKHIIETVGSFDETLKSGGDKQWGHRVYKAGYRQLYASESLVRHPARNTWEDLCKRYVRIIGGRYDLLDPASMSNIDLLKDFILFLRPPFRFFLRTWHDTRLQGINQKIQFTVVMLRLRWAAIQERTRLQFGNGMSERG